MGKARVIFRVLLGACLAAGAAQLADLLLYTDPASGFATAGPAALRWLVWLALGGACLLLRRLASPRPAALQAACPALGACMLATAALLALAALAALPGLARGGVMAWLDAAAPLATALWLARWGGQLRRAMPPRPLPGVWQAAPALAFWVWVLLRRFEFAPAAVERLPCTLRVLSASAAVAFALLLAKLFLVPGLACGRGLFAAGLALFGYGTCLELPRALWEAGHGAAGLYTVCTAAGLAAFGLCGAVAARCTLTPHLAAAEDAPPEKAPKPEKQSR